MRSSINRISLTLNRPITKVVKAIPSLKPTLLKVKRYTPVIASIPTVESARPMSAIIKVLKGCVLTRPVKQTIAKTIKAKYSAGPNAIAHFANIGANNTIPIKATVLPTKELTDDKDNAIPAFPCCANG